MAPAPSARYPLRFFGLAGIAALAGVSLGCPRSAPPPPADEKRPVTRRTAARLDAAPLVAVRRAAAASQPATPADGPPEALGIVECDRYLVQHRRCITQRVPAALREMALEGLQSTHQAWKKALRETDVARLRLSCETTAETTRRAMARYGCRYKDD